MGLIDIILVAIGLSMDAFAVAVCKGISFKTRLPTPFSVVKIGKSRIKTPPFSTIIPSGSGSGKQENLRKLPFPLYKIHNSKPII